ncbi:MAG: hypothetical protein QXJ73_08545 [Candidatus Caldarchaeum sp.]
MELKEYEHLWISEVRNTQEVLEQLVTLLKTKQHLPRVRAPQLQIGPYTWPDTLQYPGDLCIVWRKTYDVPLPGGRRERVSITGIRLNEVARTPGDLHRAIEKIRWIRRWCLARIDGIRRAEAELLRQQKDHVEWLARERAAQELAR